MRTFVRAMAVVLFACFTSIFFQNCGSQKGFAVNSPMLIEDPLLESPASSDPNFLIYKPGAEIPKMFGFFADAMQGVGNGNYIRNTYKHANIHFISGDSPGMIAEKMKFVKAAKSNAVLMLQNQIFDWKTARIQNQAEGQIKAIKQKLEADKTLGSVIAIYVIDEPYWTNNLNSTALSASTVYQNLQAAGQLVRSVFGENVLLMSSEAYPILEKHMAQNDWPGFPENYDLLAVNCYLAFGTVCDTDEKYLGLINALQSALKSNQKLFLTLDNYWNSTEGQKPAIQEKLIQRTNYQVQIAKDKDIRVLVSFLYQSMPATTDNLIGMDQMPLLYAHVQDVSNTHLSRPLNPPPEPTEEPATQPTTPQSPAPRPEPAPTTQSCERSPTVLTCSVDGVSKAITTMIEASAAHGEKTQLYSLPPGYEAERMQVEWKCANGKWVFSHPYGWCSLKSGSTKQATPVPTPVSTPAPAPTPTPTPQPSTNTCEPQTGSLLCSVNGVQGNVAINILGTGKNGDTTTSYSLPAGYSTERMAVQWKCSNGRWIFSHTSGWCALKK